MSKFEVRPTLLKKKDIKLYKSIPDPLPKPPLSVVILASRRSGKSTTCVSLLMNGGYIKAFSEVLLLSETIAHDKTYAPLSKFDNVSVHDISKHPINNELLAAIWHRQNERFKEDKKNDLLVVFDDLGDKMKSKDMRAWMNKYAQLGRHPGISFINIVQSPNNLTSEQWSNATTFIIFALDRKALIKTSEKLATAEKDAREMEDYIRKNTRKKYSWVMVNMSAERDEDVFLAFDPTSNTFKIGN